MAELIDAITAYVEQRNQQPKPFTWTTTVDSIVSKVSMASQTLPALH